MFSSFASQMIAYPFPSSNIAIYSDNAGVFLKQHSVSISTVIYILVRRETFDYLMLITDFKMAGLSCLLQGKASIAQTLRYT